MSTTRPADVTGSRNDSSAAREQANGLLTALLRAAPEWRADLEVVELRAGDTVVDRDVTPREAYFPLTCVLSKLTVLSDGRAVEFATIGREGVSGASEALTGSPTPMRAACQVPGAAARAPLARLSEIVNLNERARQVLERYTQSLLVQVGQIAACNRVHPVEERCARWLLMTHDRIAGDELLLTQEFLAQMLGVRRARVNVAAGILQKAGLIRYTRGRIRIVDRPGLERATCECYRAIRSEYERLAADIGVAEGTI